MLTDKKGKEVQRYEYDSYGNMKHQGNKVKQPYTFTSREWDEETGLYYYRARYYDAEVGRFTKPDPSLKLIDNLNITCLMKRKDPQKLNAYVYVENSPVSLIDPWGFSSTDPIIEPQQPEQPSGSESGCWCKVKQFMKIHSCNYRWHRDHENCKAQWLVTQECFDQAEQKAKSCLEDAKNMCK